jgi:hypothetical protein
MYKAAGTGCFTFKKNRVHTNIVSKGTNKFLSRKTPVSALTRFNERRKTMADKKIPYKIYLNEDEMPKSWYNLRADMKNKPAPLLNPGTLQPLKAEELAPIFCEELVAQELDETTPYIEIPAEIRDFTRCTALHPWYVLTAWRKNCRHRQRFIISSKATTPAAATSSIPPLPRLIMPRSRVSRV